MCSVKKYTPDLSYTIILVTVLIGVLILTNQEPTVFQRYLGRINPFLTILISGILGSLMLTSCLAKNGFKCYSRINRAIWYQMLGLVFGFASISIVVDIFQPFPKDMNILFPHSLLFYPVIGFFVEMLFHIFPLSLIDLIRTRLFKKTNQEKLLWGSILTVALLEPTYQIAMGDYPLWAMMLIWINLVFFNLSQLILFKSHGFFWMYLFRLLYYFLWHILWGEIRVFLLF